MNEPEATPLTDCLTSYKCAEVTALLKSCSSFGTDSWFRQRDLVASHNGGVVWLGAYLVPDSRIRAIVVRGHW